MGKNNNSRLEGSRGVSHGAIWGKSIQGGGTELEQSPSAGVGVGEGRQ